MRKLFKRTAAALGLGLSLLAQAQPVSQPPVRIALIESLSGAFANTGAEKQKPHPDTNG